jgi:hypothetical protein
MRFQKIGTLIINDKRWSYGWGDAGRVKSAPNDGICNYEKRRIIINRKPKRSFANVFCHELAHARFPDLEEQSIEELGSLLEEMHREMLKSIAVGGKATRLRGR